MRTVPLFGGALTAKVPATFVDVSRMRDIPDNQEVWVDASMGPADGGSGVVRSSSSGGTAGDAALIIEILEREDSVRDDDPASCVFYFNDLAEANGVRGEPLILSPPRLLTPADAPALLDRPQSTLPPAAWTPAPPCGSVMVGLQQVPKRVPGGGGAPVPVDSVVVYLALLRIPAYTTDVLVTYSDPVSSASELAAVTQDPAAGPALLARAAPLFSTILSSLRIVDASLFTP